MSENEESTSRDCVWCLNDWSKRMEVLLFSLMDEHWVLLGVIIWIMLFILKLLCLLMILSLMNSIFNWTFNLHKLLYPLYLFPQLLLSTCQCLARVLVLASIYFWAISSRDSQTILGECLFPFSLFLLKWTSLPWGRSERGIWAFFQSSK